MVESWRLPIEAQQTRQLLSKWILANGMEIVADLDRSHGSYLYDAQRQVEFLDVFGFFGSRSLAFNHPKYAEPAFQKHLMMVAKHKPSNCDLYTPEYAAFVDAFGSKALAERFAHVFFVEGGSLAVENAMKAAIDWKHKKNSAAGRGTKGTQILHFKQCFHGRSGYCLSVTDSYDPRKTRDFPKFDWPRVTNPKLPQPYDPSTMLAEVEALEQQAISEIHAALDAREHHVAAMLIEPIQGEGGDNYFRTEFLQQLRTIADEREVMLIFDEVQTGFGSTGQWWDYLNHQVQPDLLTFGKKTQVCGFAATSRIDEIDGVFKEGSRISTTFEGGLVDMFRCLRSIEIIEEDDLLSNARAVGEHLLNGFSALCNDYDAVSAARGRGLWCAFNLPSMQERDRIVERAFEEQLLLIPSGTHAIRARPALDLSTDDVDEAMLRLRRALDAVYR